MAHFTVIGLGRFGVAVSMELIRLGHTVTGVDRSPKIAEKYVEQFSQMVICDATDEASLKELDLADDSTVLVAIGEDLQSSILCTLGLKNIGVKSIWVKASTKAHHTILSKLGVTRIIHPENDMGIHVAQALSYPMVTDYLSLGHGYFVVEIHLKPEMANLTLKQLFSDTKGSIDAILIKRDSEMFTRLSQDFTVRGNDILVLYGKREELKHLAPKLA